MGNSYDRKEKVWFAKKCAVHGQSSDTLPESELKQHIPKSTDSCQHMKYSCVNETNPNF